MPNPAEDAPSADPTAGSAEALAEFAAAAAAIPDAEVRVIRGDPALAFHNVSVGLAAVAPHEAALSGLPAPFNLAQMKSLSRIALGLIYAAAQVDRASPGTTAKLHKRVAELRDVLMAGGIALMKAGHFPAAKMKKILAGRGPRDASQDCVDLAQLFRDNAAAIKNKTAVTKAEIDEAATAGDQLLQILKPARAKAKVSETVKSAVATRDRMWTLLSLRHEAQLRRAGMWVWVDDVDEHVPPLLSSVRKKKAAATVDGGGAPA